MCQASGVGWARKRLPLNMSGGENERFPMATTFTAEIPAGTTSATGNALEETVTWTFATPAPTLTFYTPSYGPQPRNALIFVGFDQLIDPTAVLETISVTAGGKDYAIAQASAEEVAANENITALTQRVGRWALGGPPRHRGIPRQYNGHRQCWPWHPFCRRTTHHRNGAIL